MLSDLLPPASPVGGWSRRVADVDELAQLFARWQGRFAQLSPGPFEANIRVVQGRLCRGLRAGFRHLVRGQGRPGPGWVTITPVLPTNDSTTWHGRRLPAGHVVFNGPDVGVDHCTGRRSETISLSLPGETFRQAAAVLLQAEPPAFAPASLPVLPPPAAFARLQLALRRWVDTGSADGAFAGSGEGGLLEQECLRAAAAAVLGGQTAPGAAAVPNRARLAARAEELMRACLRRPLGAVDLCAALGVSDRTLRLAFRERYRLGPMAYYKALRLNAVREALKTTPPAAASVAGVARGWGFHHLGNFSADYRRLFHERPSDTLHRGGRGPR